MSFYYLACIAMRRGEYAQALELCEKGLTKNTRNIKARGLKAVLLRKLGCSDAAEAWQKENLAVDPFDFVSGFECYLLTGEQSALDTLQGLMRGFHENYLAAARDYAEFGSFEEAVKMLELCPAKKPMVLYSLGYYRFLAGDSDGAFEAFAQGEKADPLYCFPNKLEDIAVLEAAISALDAPAKAYYYLGCLYYDKLQFEKAAQLWEASEKLDDTFPTVKRNLSLAYFNKQGKPQLALEKLEAAFALDESDARVFLELDQLYKKLNRTPQERLAVYEKHTDIIMDRDDLLIEYITLLNSTGQYEKAHEVTMGHVFRPWEGAEGKITAQYKVSLREMARKKLAEQDASGARELLEQALSAPQSLGEGHLEGTKDNDLHYWLGEALEQLGEEEAAKEQYSLSLIGNNEPAGMMYYYDQPADMILYQGLAWMKMGKVREANACFYKLIDYGERHLRDHVRIDYFAVSLPDFLIFEDDLNVRNEAHCYYLMGLGKLGLGKKGEAAEDLEKVLERDPGHQNGILYREMALR
jgi:tetratricopeptide (TPR) repeat protein